MLNSQQRKALDIDDGPILLLAGPGSGKTFLLKEKIIKLVKEKGLFPNELLAITFTNKASRELKMRVSNSLKDRTPEISTFHSCCIKLLRQYASRIGFTPNFVIYDDSDRKTLIKSLNESTDDLNEIFHYIDHARYEGFYSTMKDKPLYFNDPYYKDYLRYEEALLASNAMDFGSIITNTLKLFHENKDILERIQDQIKYLLVDEYQDTNKAQFELITLIGGKYKNVCVVGDEDQSIYSWRGADINNILSFEDIYPQANILFLEENYRSSPEILEVANSLIEKNKERKGKKIFTKNKSLHLPEIIEYYNDKRESENIVEKIKRIPREKLDEVAILFRNNYQSRIFEDYLMRERIPYRLVGLIRFYEREEIKDLICYLRVIHNPKDFSSISRIINKPARSIGKKTLEKIFESPGKNILDKLKNTKLSKKAQEGADQFKEIIEKGIDLKNRNSLRSLLEHIVSSCEYVSFLEEKKSEKSQEKLANILEFISTAEQFEQDNLGGINEFLDYVSLSTMEDEESNHKVNLMTVHASKGLEFDHVFISGLEDEVFPSIRSIKENRFEEERRLFYVAITRARKRLEISYARSRYLYGKVQDNYPSKFLKEIKAHCNFKKKF